jgi:hypothetical protein
MSNNQQLEELSLGNNNWFTNYSALKFGQTIMRNGESTLRKFSLSSRNISTSGVEYLARCFEYNNSLIELNMFSSESETTLRNLTVDAATPNQLRLKKVQNDLDTIVAKNVKLLQTLQDKLYKACFETANTRKRTSTRKNVKAKRTRYQSLIPQ